MASPLSLEMSFSPLLLMASGVPWNLANYIIYLYFVT